MEGETICALETGGGGCGCANGLSLLKVGSGGQEHFVRHGKTFSLRRNAREASSRKRILFASPPISCGGISLPSRRMATKAQDTRCLGLDPEPGTTSPIVPCNIDVKTAGFSLCPRYGLEGPGMCHSPVTLDVRRALIHPHSQQA